LDSENTNRLLFKRSLIIYLSILFIALINFLIILFAPLLVNSSGFLSDLGFLIYALFSKSCHQIKDRSFFVFGEYLPVCIRCFSIYTGFLLGSIVFPFIRKFNFFALPKISLFIFSVVLIIIDVSLNLFGFLDNFVISRIVTGGFLGTVAAFYIIPGFVNAYFEIFIFFKKKKIQPYDKTS